MENTLRGVVGIETSPSLVVYDEFLRHYWSSAVVGPGCVVGDCC